MVQIEEYEFRQDYVSTIKVLILDPAGAYLGTFDSPKGLVAGQPIHAAVTSA